MRKNLIKLWATQKQDLQIGADIFNAIYSCIKLKECHPRCIYQNYNGLIINNGSQEHIYIYKYNNSPTTCFGLIRPSSGWNTVSEEKLSV